MADNSTAEKILLQQVLPKLEEIGETVARVDQWKIGHDKVHIETINPRLDDYSGRIRLLEKHKWKLGGACTIIAIGIPLLLRYIL